MNKSCSGSYVLKTVALLLAITMLFVSHFDFWGVILSADSTPTDPYVALNGEMVDNITLNEDAKLQLEAVFAETEEQGYFRWQIKHPDGDDRWIDISDSYSKHLWLTHALVGSMLKDDGTTQLRCRMITESAELFTSPVKVTLSYNKAKSEDRADTSSSSGEAPVVMKSRSRAGTETGEHSTFSIVINYLFDNNAMAFEPYGASVAAGSDFKATITSPTVVGYAPFRRVGNNYVDASKVELDLTNIRENITIDVIYEPALVEFSVHHHLQNLLDDEYSVSYDLITKGQALTGSVVGEGLALTEAELPGFKSLAYEKLTVAADGSTVIEIRYDRNYYLIDFDMAGGYGTDPVYTRYGAPVGANTPIRHGYVFAGWELVSYGGEVPTAEQAKLYELKAGQTITVPAANLSYRARWITQETTYTMVFWCENANDNGYSYWGYLDNLKAMSGSYVDGQDLISSVAGIDDEEYFTFNENKTEKHVLVEGDGSTVVNVYYTRNYYKLTFKAAGLCTIPEKHTHTDACYDIICGLGHVHTDECIPTLECVTPEHTEHTADCVICEKAEHVHGAAGCSCTKKEHTHVASSCWSSVGAAQQTLSGAPRNPEDGQIFRSGTRYYIYISGTWYRYNGRGVSSGDIVDSSCGLENHTHGTDCSCDQEPHTHTDSCYSDILHTHVDGCYEYSCGQISHIHDNKCNRLICPVTEGHTHTSDCNRATKTNVVKTVYAKYGESLKHIWPVTDDNGVVYDNGERWSPSESSYFTQVLVYSEIMSPDDFTLTLSTANYKTYIMQYYLQVLPGESYDITVNGKNYKLDNTIKAIYNYITKAEDFFDIRGFIQSSSTPAFGSNGQISTSGSSLTVDFCYDRITDHYLQFNNNGTVLDDKEVNGIMFGAPLASYDFVPEYPDNLEPNAYAFSGWYTSPGCFAGTEVNWETLTMPEGDLMLYAKWSPITHTVSVFKDESLTEQIGPTQIVDHKAFATAPVGNVSNGNYVFQGWFYKEVVNGVEVEKAFVFNGIPILEDMVIYAKWSSHVSVPYKVNYKIFNTDTDIADPTEGSAIAGHNKTFDAKAEDQLYEGYQKGYYPLTNSHTITMSVDGTHEFTFYYVYVESMPYEVQYVNQETGEKLCEDKVVMDNSLSVVTETFKRFDKMMPDAYQKRLVLSANNTDDDNDGVYDANVITFYYSEDEEHAYYRIVHYIQNINGDTYREYRTEESTGLIGESYTATALDINGFNYIPSKTIINGVAAPSTGSTVTTTLSADGALIELYYDRQPYSYVVRYVDSRTGTELSPAKTGSGLFGASIVEYALGLEEMGYELVSDNVKSLNISANEDHNVIEFLYQERTVSVKYQIVGPAGCGALSQYSENLAALSGVPNGSYPILANGFVFLGWYTDEACTKPVNESLVDSQTNRLVPERAGNTWEAVIYYAKFASLETDLTITTKSTLPSDANQTFLFHIKGKEGTETEGIDLTVAIVGNSSLTVTKLPTGEYTVTELTEWSWRYENDEAQREISLEYNGGSNELVYDNSRENGKWLDGNDVKNNQF